MRHLRPESLTGQMMLAVAAALLLAQGIGAGLAYRAGVERREAALLHSVAFRVLSATRGQGDADAGIFGPRGRFGPEESDRTPQRAGEKRDADAEHALRRILGEQELAVRDVVVIRRAISSDPAAQRRLQRQMQLRGPRHGPSQTDVLVVGVQRADNRGWIVARVFVPLGEREIVLTLLGQTLFIYLFLVGTIALILRRITRPLAALTGRLERFAETRSLDGQLVPGGPHDVRRLIVAHNAMEARIAALLDEKDVMLGAIGHDLKTPLAALRVRIESVENESERDRMAATIEDIVRSLDDILSLARVGRPSDPVERTELSALIASIVEEYEDMGEPVALEDTPRLVMPLRPTWLRRALRNLIDNAIRYGQGARVSLAREGDSAVVRVEDNGPGIAPDDIARMLEPFSRGEPSRNSGTGGAGLGLTLARAIAEQHGGSLTLANREGAAGLIATVRLPISAA